MTLPANDLHLYRWFALDPATGYTTERLAYVGKSARPPFARIGEHREDKSWEDTYTRHERDPRVFRSEAELAAAEEELIRRERPLYNDQLNRENPARIDYDEQVRQRHERDDAAGRPRWQPNGRRPTRRAAVSRPPVRASRRLTRRQRRARLRLAGYGTAWVGLAGLAWWGLPQLELPSGPAWSTGSASVVLAGGRLAWWFLGLSRRRRGQVVGTAVALLLAAIAFAAWWSQR